MLLETRYFQTPIFTSNLIELHFMKYSECCLITLTSKLIVVRALGPSFATKTRICDGITDVHVEKSPRFKESAK